MEFKINYKITAGFDDKEITMTSSTTIPEDAVKELTGESIYSMTNEEILETLLDAGCDEFLEETEAEYLAHNEFKEEYEATNMFPWIELSELTLEKI